MLSEGPPTTYSEIARKASSAKLDSSPSLDSSRDGTKRLWGLFINDFDLYYIPFNDS